MKKAKPETGRQAVADAIAVLLSNPETPADLYNDVSQWVTSATNIEDSEGESLCSRWTHHPDTIRACVNWHHDAASRKGGAA